MVVKLHHAVTACVAVASAQRTKDVASLAKFQLREVWAMRLADL